MKIDVVLQVLLAQFLDKMVVYLQQMLWALFDVGLFVDRKHDGVQNTVNIDVIWQDEIEAGGDQVPQESFVLFLTTRSQILEE